MVLPTLMIKGKLVAPTGDPAVQRELDDWIPYEYTTNWFKSRLGKTGVENRVVIIKAETASGKSTLLPPMLYQELITTSGPGLICTQPRVITAIKNVGTILEHNKFLRKGENIGWSTQSNKMRPKSYGLLSATIGTLAQQLKVWTDAEIIEKYRVILIDETHERDLQTDMTIYMLKNFILRNQDNPKCPFVALMSATFEPDAFLKYFNIDIATNYIHCVGEAAGFDEKWDWNQGRTVSNYPRVAADVVREIVYADDDEFGAADILIFMPGAAEIKQTRMWLDKVNESIVEDFPENPRVFSALSIDSSAINTETLDYKRMDDIPVDKQLIKVGDSEYPAYRRVIISTNVAETGLNLVQLKYVIDGGYNRGTEFNPVYGIRGLITIPAPISRIKQRKGRAGRNFPGVFYPLYPKYIYDRLPELQLPTILVDDISAIMIDIINEQLRVKKLAGDKDPEFLIEDIDMIDVPTPDALAYCIEKLYAIGFISPKAPRWSADVEDLIVTPADNQWRFGLTKLGAIASKFNMMTPESVRMILAAYSWGCSVTDIITIAAWLNLTASDFVSGETQKEFQIGIRWNNVYKEGLNLTAPYDYKIQLLIADGFIDGLILFNAVKNIIVSTPKDKMISTIKDWCFKNNIKYERITKFLATRDDILEQAIGSSLLVTKHADRALINCTSETLMDIITRLKHCIYDGYRQNILTLVGQEYKTATGLVVLVPKRAILSKMDPGLVEELVNVKAKCLVYQELTLKLNKKTQVYSVMANLTSTMDGYVSWDPDFLM